MEDDEEVVDGAGDSDADLNAVLDIAKVMATRISWSMTLAMTPQGSLHGARTPQVSLPEEENSQYTIIRGSHPARMRPGKAQTGLAVQRVLSDLTGVPGRGLLERIFRGVQRVDSTHVQTATFVKVHPRRDSQVATFDQLYRAMRLDP